MNINRSVRYVLLMSFDFGLHVVPNTWVYCVCHYVGFLTSISLLFYTVMSFNVVFHHGGEFVRDWVVYYREGSKSIVYNSDVDKWSFFEATRLLADLGIDNSIRL